MRGAKQCRPPMQGTGGTGPLPLELASPCPHTLARAYSCSLSSFDALSRSRGAAASHERVLMDPSSSCPNRARERLWAVHVEMFSCTQPPSGGHRGALRALGWLGASVMLGFVTPPPPSAPPHEELLRQPDRAHDRSNDPEPEAKRPRLEEEGGDADAPKAESATEKLARLRALQAARSGLHGGRVGSDYTSRKR
mmetsp:Transcript_32044/g.106938  ORF Transcript_32044/g.106938 Transcript_32044/m.106938 type:complete len:195 (-) Transcript_32044:148-732(-)